MDILDSPHEGYSDIRKGSTENEAYVRYFTNPCNGSNNNDSFDLQQPYEIRKKSSSR